MLGINRQGIWGDIVPKIRRAPGCKRLSNYPLILFQQTFYSESAQMAQLYFTILKLRFRRFRLPLIWGLQYLKVGVGEGNRGGTTWKFKPQSKAFVKSFFPDNMLLMHTGSSGAHFQLAVFKKKKNDVRCVMGLFWLRVVVQHVLSDNSDGFLLNVLAWRMGWKLDWNDKGKNLGGRGGLTPFGGFALSFAPQRQMGSIWCEQSVTFAKK